MEIIPLITLRKGQIVNENYSSIDNIDENKTLYILDFDGIERNKPNLDTVQELSKKHELLWVDNGPYHLGDIVDTMMVGATNLTIRKKLCPQVTIQEIKELTENEIYENIELENQTTQIIDDDFSYESDGLVNFYKREEIEKDFKIGQLLKQYSIKQKIYSYETDLKNLGYWETLGVHGLIVDINKIEEKKANEQ